MGINTARGIHDAGSYILFNDTLCIYIIFCYKGFFILFKTGWERFGYQFATPEAWEQSGNYRSLGYMRPLAVWAIQYALEHGKQDTLCSDDANNKN